VAHDRGTQRIRDEFEQLAAERAISITLPLPTLAQGGRPGGTLAAAGAAG
jgi:hypothetical protein